MNGYLGQIILSPWDFAPRDCLSCDGRRISKSRNRALSAVVGESFGKASGDSFVLPDLRGRTGIGAGGPGMIQIGTNGLNAVPGDGDYQGWLALQYVIFYEGVFPSPKALMAGRLGQIMPWAGTVVPKGWQFCRGQELTIADYPSLFGLIGKTYGGDGTKSFNLPNLTGTSIVGTGKSPDFPIYRLGHARDSKTSLTGKGLHGFETINYIIMTDAIPPGAVLDPPIREPYIGEIAPWPAAFAPPGWQFCHGQMQSIEQNPPLFSLIGTRFGGDGRVSFALPDLRGRIPIGATKQPNGVAGPIGTNGSYVIGGLDQRAWLPLEFIIAVRGAFPMRA